jgi:hypothetical protein
LKTVGFPFLLLSHPLFTGTHSFIFNHKTEFMSTSTRISIPGSTVKRQSVTARVKACRLLCALLFVALLSTGSARATILTTLTGTEATITSCVFDYQIFENECGVYAYRQRMVIGGKTEMVYTEFIYPVGTHTLEFRGQCDGMNSYNAGSCGCIAKAPVMTPTLDVDLSRKEKVNAYAQHFSIAASDLHTSVQAAGALWIRKENKV